MWKTVLSFPCAASNVFLYIKLHGALFHKKLSLSKAILLIVIYSSVLGSLLLTSESSVMASVLGVALTYLSLSMFFLQLSFRLAVGTLLLFSLAQALGEGAAMLMLRVWLQRSPELIHTSALLSMAVQLLRLGAVGLLLLSIYRSPWFVSPFEPSTSLTRLFLPICLLVALCLAKANLALVHEATHSSTPALAIYSLNVMGYCVSSIALVPLTYQLEARSIANRQLGSTFAEMQGLTDELESFRHNYRNVLHGLGGLIEHAEWDELKAYFNEVAADFRAKTTRPSHNALWLVRHPALSGVLAEKMRQAEERGIPFSLHINQAISRIPIAAPDLCLIVGIFLDNALEAALATPNGWVRVEIQALAGQLHLLISNSCSEFPDLGRINNRGYSLKGLGRGLGLFEVKRILRSYPTVLHNTFVRDASFCQEVVVLL